MIPDGRKRLCHIDVQAVLALKQVKSPVKNLLADDGYDVIDESRRIRARLKDSLDS
jgi:hypothetical protein